jgi:hypothetical protein
MWAKGESPPLTATQNSSNCKLNSEFITIKEIGGEVGSAPACWRSSLGSSPDITPKQCQKNGQKVSTKKKSN